MGFWAMGRVREPPEPWVGMISTGGALGAMTAKQHCENCLDVHIPDMYYVRVPLPVCSRV